MAPIEIDPISIKLFLGILGGFLLGFCVGYLYRDEVGRA